MLSQNVLCVCFMVLLAPKIEINAKQNNESEKPEAIFADVIKNISRVNNELQDLITNYEQFKKMQNSQENLLSDPEGGRVNRNKSNVGNKRVSSDTTLSYNTEIIFVDEKSSNSESNSAEQSNEAHKSKEVEKSKEAEKSKEVEKSKEAEKTSEEQKSKEAEKNSKSQNSNEVKEIHEELTSKETTNKKNHKVQKTTTQTSAYKKQTTPKQETESEDQESIAAHKNMKIKANKTIISEAQIKQEKSHSGKEKEPKIPWQPSSDSDISEGEQHTKEKDDDDSSEVKKGTLGKDDDGVISEVTAAVYLRTGINGSRQLKKSNKDTLELTDDDDLSKDVFKTSILREAYGDACLKLVIRKCSKACKNALKISCRARKCKRDLKKYFITETKTECIKAFTASTAKEETENSLRRVIPGAIDINKGIMARNGYLSMACHSGTDIPSRRMPHNSTRGPQLNILRVKYERACRKSSQKKCIDACNNATITTCEKYECRKRMKKDFKRNCKSNCKAAYSKSGFISSDSGSGSGSNSGSGSESGSGSGSDDNSDSDDSNSKSKSKS